MNWKEIKKKYPKAINKLFEWLSIFEYKSRSSLLSKEAGTKWFRFEQDYLKPPDGFPWNERNLYDFFDEQGINLSIVKTIEKKDFWFRINNIHSYYDLGLRYKSRKEAEEQVFLEAFKILEKQLK